MGTWLTPLVADLVNCPTKSFSLFQMDRTEESGNSKGGGVCFMTNNKQCNPKDMKTLFRSCSPNLDTDMALSALHDVLCRHQTHHPDAAVVVTGDFNRSQSKEINAVLPSHYVCYQGRKNFGLLLYTIQERLQGCLSSPFREVLPFSCCRSINKG